MIHSLQIKNFALIDKNEVQFKNGLNIITGESGAGKSILVNAINQLCGERSSLDFIKAGTKKAVIEAEIDISALPHLTAVLSENDIDNDSQLLIIRKEINSSGNSRIFINDSPVHLAILNKVSQHLIDLHGQHQHQTLLHPENHLQYLDSFADLESALADFKTLALEYDHICADLNNLKNEQAQALQMADLYALQKKELEAAELVEGELQSHEDELKILSNYEKMHQAAQQLVEALSHSEINASYLLNNAQNSLQSLAEIDPQFQSLTENLNIARDTVEEIAQFTERYMSNADFDPERAEFLRQRLHQLEFLLKKYQKTSVEDLILLNEELNNKLEHIHNFDSDLQKLDKQKEKLEKVLLKCGIELHQKRCEAAEKFEKKLSAFLNEIGMSHSRFKFEINLTEQTDSPFIINKKSCRLLADGFDTVLISFSPNAGEPLKPINKVASGGELSRIMLALKSVLAEKDKTPVLVFDEIDSGISGKTAQVVGKKISDLARYHQIICITHLPQIAAFADFAFKVDKQSVAGNTAVSIIELQGESRTAEIAHLLGGVTLSPQAFANAQQLLDEASKSK